MTPGLPYRIALAMILCFAVASLGGCASAPDIDGGIVGTGNRVDCAALAKKERPHASAPQECP